MNALACPYCGLRQDWKSHGITVSGDRQTIRYRRESAYLTQSQLIVFEILFDAIGHTVSRQKLHGELYRYISQAKKPDLKAIDCFIYQTRKRLRPLGLEIKNVSGFGFRLEIPINDASNRRAA